MYVVDASVWASYYIPDDIFHPRSREWIVRQVEASEVITAPAIFLAEVSGAVSRRTGSPQRGNQVLLLMQRLPNLQVVEIDADFARFSAEMAAGLRLRGADAVYVSLAQRLGIPLITWDQEQLQRGVSVVTALTPEAALG